MKKLIPCLMLSLALAASNQSLSAELRLPSIFGDGMVLQRGKPAAIWVKLAVHDTLFVANLDIGSTNSWGITPYPILHPVMA